MGGVSYFAYNFAQDMVSKQINEKIELIKNAQKNTIRTLINRVNEEVAFFAQKESIYAHKYDNDVKERGVSEGDKFVFDDNYYYIFLLKSLELAEQNWMNDQFLYSYITTSQGVVIADSRVKSEEEVPQYVGNRITEERYRSSRIEKIYVDEDQKYFLAQFSIYRRNTNIIVGYYTIAVSLDIFYKNIDAFQDELFEEYYLVNDEGIIFNHSQRELIGDKDNEAWYLDIINKDINGAERINKRDYQLVERIDHERAIYLVATIPVKVLNEPVNKIRNIVFLISFLAIVLIFFSSYLLISQVLNPLNSLLLGFSNLEKGELSEEILLDEKNIQKDEIGILSLAFNSMVKELRSIIGKLIRVSVNVGDASNKLQTSSNELGSTSSNVAVAIMDVTQGSEEQNSSISNINEKTKKLSNMVEKLDKSNQEMKNSATTMTIASENGGQEMERVSQQMENIKTSIDQVAGEINNLNEITLEIDNILSIINSMANQTNILSINASIEAARAGEAGKGFGVVAGKIKDLAEESANSAGKIKDLINDIKEKAENTSLKMKVGIQEIDNGKQQVIAAREAFGNINLSIQEVVSNLNETDLVVQSIKSDSIEITDHIDYIATISEENSARTQEVAAASQEQTAFVEEMMVLADTLAQMAEDLNKLIARFKV
jgi:methyl-accepting chemotaxis protein